MKTALNTIRAKVKHINNYDGLNLVEFDFNNIKLSMIGLELPNGIELEKDVLLGVKPSHVTIAKSYALEVSYSNKIRTVITHIDDGKLLCNIKMSCEETTIEALITKKSKENMHLKVGDKVAALIKSSELYIKEVL